MHRLNNASLIWSQFERNNPCVEADYLDIVLNKVAGIFGALGVLNDLFLRVGSLGSACLDVLVSLKSFAQSIPRLFLLVRTFQVSLSVRKTFEFSISITRADESRIGILCAMNSTIGKTNRLGVMLTP